MKYIKHLFKWIFPAYRLAETLVFIKAVDEKTQYIKLYCKMHGINYVDWFPTEKDDDLIVHRIKTKGWFE